MLLSAGSGRRRAFRRWQPSGSSSPSEPSLASDARTLAPKLFNSIRGSRQPTGPASVRGPSSCAPRASWTSRAERGRLDLVPARERMAVACRRHDMSSTQHACFGPVSATDLERTGTSRTSRECADGDDDSTSCLSALDIADGVGGVAQCVRPIDDWCDLPGFDELVQDEQVLGILLCDERAQLLAHEWRTSAADLTAHAGPTATAFAADDDERPCAGESARIRDGRVAADVEDQVEVRPLGEIVGV